MRSERLLCAAFCSGVQPENVAAAKDSNCWPCKSAISAAKAERRAVLSICDLDARFRCLKTILERIRTSDVLGRRSALSSEGCYSVSLAGAFFAFQ
jgi:hypothetical protein